MQATSPKRSACGELLVQATESDGSLALTDRTANVLRAYIDNEPVRTHDRMDMTIRRRSAKARVSADGSPQVTN